MVTISCASLTFQFSKNYFFTRILFICIICAPFVNRFFHACHESRRYMRIAFPRFDLVLKNSLGISSAVRNELLGFRIWHAVHPARRKSSLFPWLRRYPASSYRVSSTWWEIRERPLVSDRADIAVDVVWQMMSVYRAGNGKKSPSSEGK